MSQNSEEIWENIPDITGTIYDPNPLAKGWILTHGPNIPALNELKNKLIVNVPPLPRQEKRTVESVWTPNQTHLKKTKINLSEHSVEKSLSSSTLEGPTDKTISHTSSGHVRQTVNTKQTEELATVRKKPARVLPSTVGFQPISKPLAAVTQPPQQSDILPQRPNISQSTPKRRTLPQLKNNVVNKKSYPSHTNAIMKTNQLYRNLNEEQKKIHKAVLLENKNVLITGSTGTGKSPLLNSIISSLEMQNNHDHIAIVAAASATATNTQGNTLLSFISMDTPERSVDYCISEIRKNPTKIEYLKNVNVLIVKGISMIDAELFKKVEYICRKIRVDGRPFGGIQVVLCGDSDLLPPGTHRFPFQSEISDRVIQKSFVLRTTS